MPTRCPFCLYFRSWIIRRNKRKCKKCKHEFSINDYPVKGIRSTDKEWRESIHIFLRERASERIYQETNIGRSRAIRMTHFFRVCMLMDMPEKFIGPVEIDETYIGGQRKNKKLHIRRFTKSKRGHGTTKLAVVGIFDRLTKQIYMETIIHKPKAYYMFSVIRNQIQIGAQVYSDAFKLYRGLGKIGYLHKYVDHDDGEYVRGEIHTNNIEGFWGILKRKLGCIGGMRRDRIKYFAAEMVWRFNNRKLSFSEQEEKLYGLILKCKIGGKS